MSHISNSIEQPWIQRNVLWLAGVFFFGSFTLYFLSFDGPLSDEQGTWGQFGDYMGGVVNPIIGLCTVWLLTVSLKQNQVALQQAREELGLAREALEASNAMQQKTEAALNRQVQVAEHARDMSNAVSLLDNLDARMVTLRDHLSRGVGDRLKVSQQLRDAIEMAEAIGGVLEDEYQRLLMKYNPTSKAIRSRCCAENG